MTENGKCHDIKKLNDSEINKEQLSALRSVKDELSVHCGVVLLRNDRIIMSTSLRAKVIQLGHEGHQGVVRTKSYVAQKSGSQT